MKFIDEKIIQAVGNEKQIDFDILLVDVQSSYFENSVICNFCNSIRNANQKIIIIGVFNDSWMPRVEERIKEYDDSFDYIWELAGRRQFMEKFDAKKALAGAAALLIIAAALWVTAKALQEFGKVSWGAMAKAGVALLGLVLVLAAIGAIMMSGVGAVAILAGAGAMLIMAAALLVLGVAIQAIGKGFDMLAQGLGSFLPTIMTLAPMAKAIFVLAGAFTALGYSMAAMALGALTLLPALPILMTLAALGMLGGSVLGGGGEEAAAGGAESNPVELKLEEKIYWLKRYLIHLEKGGKRIKAGPDYWAQHENHKLIVEHGEDEQGNIEKDILFL